MDAQADLSLRWAHMSEDTFSHVEGLSNVLKIINIAVNKKPIKVSSFG